jgi:hypothetical protein
MAKRLVKIGEAARLMGTSVDHLRQWEKSGERLPARKTKGGTRYDDAAQLLGLGDSEAATALASLQQRNPNRNANSSMALPWCLHFFPVSRRITSRTVASAPG